jgi:type IV pilus assembly protein PilE
MRKRRGYTLIEVLIAMVIVAILASIAIPSYRQYVLRSHRRAAQTTIVDIANREQQFFAANRAYADKATLGYVEPTEVSDNYTWDVVPDNTATPPTFLITFTPIGGQVADGPDDLTLNSLGEKTPPDKW